MGWSFVYLGLCRLLQLVALLCKSERSKELEILLLREGCQNHVHSGCGSVVLVQEAAEAVATLDIAAGRYELWRVGRLERESAVGTFPVVMAGVDAKDVFEVASADDQEPVETFRSDGADEPLGVSVRLRRLHRRVDHSDPFAAEHLVEGCCELAVAIVEQEADPFEEAGEAEVARLLNDPGPGRVRRTAGEVDAPALEFDEEEHVEAAQRDRLDGKEVASEQARVCVPETRVACSQPRLTSSAR